MIFFLFVNGIFLPHFLFVAFISFQQQPHWKMYFLSSRTISGNYPLHENRINVLLSPTADIPLHPTFDFILFFFVAISNLCRNFLFLFGAI